MVVRERGGGLGPQGSNLEDFHCLGSKKDEHQILASDSGVMADGESKDSATCSCQKSTQTEGKHSTGANCRGSKPSRYEDFHNPSCETVEKIVGFEGGRCGRYVDDDAKEPGKMKVRNGANGVVSVSVSKKKSRVDLRLNSSTEIRLTNLITAVENTDLDYKFEDLAGKCTDENAADGENPLMPGLGEDVALLCLVRLPRSLYGSYYTVSRNFYKLFKSRELYKIRREMGISEQWVYLLNSGQSVWRAFNPKDGGGWRPLPPSPADACFVMCDKESLTAGTQLLVMGREIQGLAVWIYDLVLDSWFHGPQMITPRCLFASASWGEHGYVAGGVDSSLFVTNSAERYNSSTEKWEPLPPMSKMRKLCSGFCMDGKFWVIGGIDEKETVLTCGEEFDPTTKTWTKIPEMFPPSDDTSPKAPPLVAVVENQLYALDVCVNQLKLYCKKSKTWKLLGDVPVRSNFNNGWGVAFKALEGQLLLIGGYCPPESSDGNAIYAWKPSSDEGPPEWRFVAALIPPGTFVFNCAVMSA